MEYVELPVDLWYELRLNKINQIPNGNLSIKCLYLIINGEFYEAPYERNGEFYRYLCKLFNEWDLEMIPKIYNIKFI